MMHFPETPAAVRRTGKSLEKLNSHATYQTYTTSPQGSTHIEINCSEVSLALI